MTVLQLMERLQELPPDAEVVFPLQSYTQKYPAVYVHTNNWNTLSFYVTEAHDGTVRINIDTPEGVVITNRKK